MKVRCPNCKEWVEWQGSPFRPFCSAECKGLDLGKWADEQFRLAGEDAADSETGLEVGEAGGSSGDGSEDD
jgi:uncharacterized protein